MTPVPHSFQLRHIRCDTHTIPQLIEELRRLLNDSSLRPRTLNYVNAHVFNLSARDDELRENLNTSRIVTADGMAVVWAARLFGARLPERCNMTEAFRAFLADEEMPQSKALLIGCRQEEANRAAKSMSRVSTHCEISRAICGYADDEQYVELLSQSQEIDLILIGMGTPKSERLTTIAAKACPNAVVWHIGGGTIRIFAGSVNEAPNWCRRAGVQWVHRLYVDPKRMWRRYLLGNAKFISLVLVDSMKKKGKHYS